MQHVKVIDLCWAFYCCIESPVIGIVFPCKHNLIHSYIQSLNPKILKFKYLQIRHKACLSPFLVTNWPQRHNRFHENPLTPCPPWKLTTPEISHEIEGAVQIPHPLEDSDNQIPSYPGRQRCQMPGVCPRGGGMLKLRFDRYIITVHAIFSTPIWNLGPSMHKINVNYLPDAA